MQSWTSFFDPTKPLFRIAVKPKMTILGKASFRQNDSNSDDSRPLWTPAASPSTQRPPIRRRPIRRRSRCRRRRRRRPTASAANSQISFSSKSSPESLYSWSGNSGPSPPRLSWPSSSSTGCAAESWPSLSSPLLFQVALCTNYLLLYALITPTSS